MPVKATVTVWPANAETSNVFWAYPDALLRFEYVASVVLPIFAVSLS